MSKRTPWIRIVGGESKESTFYGNKRLGRAPSGSKSRKAAGSKPPRQWEKWRSAHATTPLSITMSVAQSLEKFHKCRGLADALVSSRNCFAAGWQFCGLIWNKKQDSLHPHGQAPGDNKQWEYLTIGIDNQWKDVVLLRRPARQNTIPLRDF